MAQIISCSIDVSKIDKSKLIEGKNGAKYYNFDVITKDAPDQYGKDASLSQGQSKEEREAKTPKVFIGNGKTVWSGTQKPRPTVNTKAVFKLNGDMANQFNESSDNDLPF